MPQPGKPSAAGEDWLVRRVQDLERTVKELAASNPFAPMGMTPNPNGVTFGGSVLINGNLSVPNGSISNAALASPVVSVSGFQDAEAFTIPKTDANVASFNFTVPAGYTKADITALGAAYAYNANTTADFVYARVYIDYPGGSTYGRRLIIPVTANGGSGSLAPNKQVHVEGLTGGQTITCRLVMTCDNGPITNSLNGASINAIAFFTR